MMKPARNVSTIPYPGIRCSMDGSDAVVAMETAASEAAGAYPITPSTQMGEGWAAAVAAGKPNVHGRQLLFFEPEGEHAAAGVTAGMSMVGLRSTNFSSGQGIAYMHESLYAAVGKRLTYVLNMAARAMTKHALNVHAGHDDYHAVDDTGFFQLFAKDVQESADFNLISHRIAELSLNPGICAQDGFLTSHVIETLLLPELELVKKYLGSPDDQIDSPTPAQRLVFGEQRRRIPEMFDLDSPAMLGVVQNQDAYAQGVAAQRPFYFDHIVELTEQALSEFAALTGRHYRRASGYRLEDADYVLAGQGSVVANAEAVCDWLRREKRLKVGVLNVSMFRPFPTDCIAALLGGKKAVTVLERVDQPLAVDAPLLREIRAALSKAQENSQARRTRKARRNPANLPHPGVPAVEPQDVPRFFSACFGLGSRDLQPGDLVAAVENMLETSEQRTQFYLGIDFIRGETRLPKLQIWQQSLLEGYPELGGLSLQRRPAPNLLPDGSVSLRIHSVGGWGAITMGKNVALTAAELLGLHVKANPKYGSEKKGQPTTFYATLAGEPVRLNCELSNVDVVLSPDANVFRHSDPLAGLSRDGVFVIQWDQSPQELWDSLPKVAQKRLQDGGIRVYHLDGFRIASEEASNPELRYRMQGAAFMGAFFRVSPFLERGDLDRDTLMDGIRKQLNKKFSHLGERVVADNLRVIERGFDELSALEVQDLSADGEEGQPMPHMPEEIGCGSATGLADGGRFWEQVCHLYKTGDEGIADPFAAISAIPAVTSTIRDMTDVRFEVPEFKPEKCTGCGQCWSQCPDSAIPGLVTPVDQLLEKAVEQAGNGQQLGKIRPLVRPLVKETRRLLKGAPPFSDFCEVLSLAWQKVLTKLAPAPDKRVALEQEFLATKGVLDGFPLARVAPFFDVPEQKEKDSGALLSITINPETCKGCMLCVEVCPDQALVTIKQDDDVVSELRRHWEFWKELPDTDDRYVNISSLEEGIGVLPSLLLKKSAYRSMVGGDGACMGCGEKTVLHLVVSAVDSLMGPRVEKQVKRLDELITGLDARAREILAAAADPEQVGRPGASHLDVALPQDQADRIFRLNQSLRQLKDLRWRYAEGPSGRGRARLGFANSTGCSSVWGSTYPYNPYPFPWVNHLFQDAPSVALGLFEGHMRKMADGFIAIRRAEKLLDGSYDERGDEAEFGRFDWHDFDDDEFALCPPIFAVGGDGAMMDIGFQNLSRLMASGKPLRVVVLDTQVYSNTGGQACTSGYGGQVSDMAAYGQGQHGKEESRKELGLLAIAHRNTFVLQSSQASPSHLLGGVLEGLSKRRPALFLLNCPCPPEHGIADDATMRAARLALESRAFPFFKFDPDQGAAFADCLQLDGNPDAEETWPSYELKYLDDEAVERTITLPMTIADWAFSEARFKKHYTRLDGSEDSIPFHEYLELDREPRQGKVPFIFALDGERRLKRLRVSDEVVELAEERQHFWSQLRQLAGQEITPPVLSRAEAELEEEFEKKAQAIRAEYDSRMAELTTSFPALLARRMAEGLVAAGPERTIGELLAEVAGMEGLSPIRVAPTNGTGVGAGLGTGSGTGAGLGAGVESAEVAAEPVAAAPEDEEDEDDDLTLEAYIESARCTTCNECTNLNGRMFAYNEKKQAFIQDINAGTYKDLVVAAERCPVAIIHPGDPLNPKEKDLDKWLKRAEPFNS